MRRGREKDIEKYIEVRTSQLKEEIEKCNNEYDKQWYNRIISELHWAKAELKSDCWMAEGSLRDTDKFWLHKCDVEKVYVDVAKHEPCNWCGEYQNGTTWADEKKGA